MFEKLAVLLIFVTFELVCCILWDVSETVFYGAHSHNDYQQEVPLWTAITDGIGSVEADLHLVNGILHIGHLLPTYKTLSGEYLDPIKSKIESDGSVWLWNSSQPLNLLFDLKTDAVETYAAVRSLISSQCSNLFSYVDSNGIFHQSYLHCIITGNKPEDYMLQEDPPHYCSMDSGDIANVDSLSKLFSPITSLDYRDIFGYVRTLDQSQMEQLQTMINASRANNKRLRFWGAPEDVDLWTQLVEADAQRNVIVLNADNLDEAKRFLIRAGYDNHNQGCQSTPQWCAEQTERISNKTARLSVQSPDCSDC